MDKPKLCLVIPSLQAGGMERVMSELASFFCKNPDFQVHLITYGFRIEIFYAIPENLILHKPPFLFTKRGRLFYTLKTMLFLRKTISQMSPVSILSFGEYWNNLVLLSTIGIRCPIFVSDRSQPDKKLVFPHEYLRRLLYVRAKGVIAQTKAAKLIYSNRYKHINIRVIGNPIKSVCETNQIIRENIVLSVGRLIESKHHDELIRMFVEINLPGWKLVIVGDNTIGQDIKGKLAALIMTLNAGNIVELVGKRNNVNHYYLKSKIFAFTSSSEGFPNVIGEAMSAGLPVVAWDCIAGPSELVINGINGFLIPLFAREQFKARLKELMINESVACKMGEKARRKSEEFSIETIGVRYQEFILKK